jgi:hypothetical protein
MSAEEVASEVIQRELRRHKTAQEEHANPKLRVSQVAFTR